MKRDWDLVRRILIEVEELPDLTSSLRPENIPDYPKDVVSYHIQIMEQAGFLDAVCTDYLSAGTLCIAKQLTWEGHELLSKIRDQSAWNRVRTLIKTKGFEVSYDALKTALGFGITKALGG